MRNKINVKHEIGQLKKMFSHKNYSALLIN